MKTIFIFYMIILLASVSFLQITLAFETEEESGPPQIPEPGPISEPIKLPDPDPVPDPFPEESNSEKVKRLTKENNNLKQQNKNLQNQITSLNDDKSRLQTELLELNSYIQSLKEITLEQVQVILQLVNQLKETIYEKIFSPTISL